MKTEVTVATEILENRLQVNGREAKLDNARRDLLSIPNRERPPCIQETLATLNGRTSLTEELTASSPLSRRRANVAMGTGRTSGAQKSPTLDRREIEKKIHFVNPLSFVPPSLAVSTALASRTLQRTESRDSLSSSRKTIAWNPTVTPATSTESIASSTPTARVTGSFSNLAILTAASGATRSGGACLTGHSARSSQQGLKEARVRRLPWSEDFRGAIQ